MRWLLVVLIICVSFLQYRLWVGEGSLAHRHALQNEISSQQKKNEALRKKNSILASEVKNLSVEERARKDLGMIKDGETFYMVIKKEDQL